MNMHMANEHAHLDGLRRPLRHVRLNDSRGTDKVRHSLGCQPTPHPSNENGKRLRSH